MRNISLSKILKILPVVFGLVLFSFAITSCNNSVEPNTDNPKDVLVPANGKGRVIISIGNQSSRTALPQIDVDNLTDISLTGTRNGTVTYENTWSTYASFQADSTLDLMNGNWSFTLTAYNNGFAFSDTQTTTVEIDETSNVSFSLTTTASGGGFKLRVDFSGAAQAATYSLYSYPSGTLVSTEGSGPLSITDTGSSKYVEYDRSNPIKQLSAGAYRFEAKFWGDSAKTILLNTYSEIITIKNGFISTRSPRTISLNQTYTITYEVDEGTPVAGASLIETYSINTGTISLPDMEKENYQFQGWYTAANGGGAAVTTWDTANATSTTLYAYFIPINAINMAAQGRSVYNVSFEPHTISTTNNKVIITVRDSNNKTIVPQAITVSLYENGEVYGTYNTSIFDYSAYLPALKQKNVYVSFTIKANFNTTYTYDYYAHEDNITYLGAKKPFEAKVTGDVVYNDGSADASSDVTTSAKKNAAVAIIFTNTYSNSTRNILGVSVIRTSAPSLTFANENSSGFTDVTSTDQYDGYSSLTTFRALADYPVNYPAYNWVENLEKAAGSKTDWYIPSYGEFEKLRSSKNTVENILKVINDDTTNKFVGKFWSSYVTNAGLMRFYDFSKTSWFNQGMLDPAYVCAICEF